MMVWGCSICIWVCICVVNLWVCFGEMVSCVMLLVMCRFWCIRVFSLGESSRVCSLLFG